MSILDTPKRAVGPYKVFIAPMMRFWWIVVITAMLGGIGGVVASAVLPPTYQSTAVLYVTSGSDANVQSAYQGSLASQQRVESYARLAKSDAVLSAALAESGLAVSVDGARSAVTATANPTTVILTLSARYSDPETAASLANAVSASMVRYVSELETPTKGGDPLAKLTVVTPAEPNRVPVEPRPKRWTAVGILAGLAIGVATVLLRDRFDRRVVSVDDLAGLSDRPVLGVIPESSELSEDGLAGFEQGGSRVAEEYRRLRVNLSFVKVDSPPKIVLVTSACASEGKTSTSLNLALALSEAGSSVCIVDADLRRPTMARRLGLQNIVGWSDFLRGTLELRGVIQETTFDRLFLISSGAIPPNPTELLGSRRAGVGLSELRESFDYVVVDAPPILPVADAAVISQWADGVLVVARSTMLAVRACADALQQLDAASAPVVGFVLNCAKGVVASYGYAEYGATVSAESAALDSDIR